VPLSPVSLYHLPCCAIYFSSHLPCCSLIPLFRLPCFALTRIFLRTYPAVPLIFFALTLLCPYFSSHLPCYATYPADLLARIAHCRYITFRFCLPFSYRFWQGFVRDNMKRSRVKKCILSLIHMPDQSPESKIFTSTIEARNSTHRTCP